MNKQNDKNALALEDTPRRRVLLGLSSILGATTANELLGGNAFSVAMAFSKSTKDKTSTPSVFSVDQLKTLKHICQTVIPATDTAGAGDVDTHGFIDNQLHHCFDQSAQESIIKVVGLINEKANSRYRAKFSMLPLVNATALLNDIDTCKNGFTKKNTSAFKFLKSLIVFGYYTSEVGASEELRYDAVPGEFKGRVSLDEIGSAWGSRAFF